VSGCARGHAGRQSKAVNFHCLSRLVYYIDVKYSQDEKLIRQIVIFIHISYIMAQYYFILFIVINCLNDKYFMHRSIGE